MKLYKKVLLVVLSICIGMFISLLSLFVYREGRVSKNQCSGSKMETCKVYEGYKGTRGFPFGYNKIVSLADENKSVDVAFNEVPELILNIGVWTIASVAGLYWLSRRSRR